MSDKILFQWDYNEGAHPKVFERLVQEYGADTGATVRISEISAQEDP